MLPCTHLPQLVDVLGGDLFNFHKYYWWFYCVSYIIQSQIDQCASYIKSVWKNVLGEECSSKSRDYYGAFLREALRRVEKFTLTVHLSCVLAMS